MTPSRQEPIAIVGSACRFPGGANSPASLWKLLESPRDVGVEIGPDRFDATAFYHPDGGHHGTSNVLRSYLLQEDVRVFDAAFFNLSPNEADAMDPQQRLLLETVYEALEAGGHALNALRGSDTAVYVGTMTADYNDTLIRDHNTMPKYFATGTNRAIISNRVSYFFDWHGPSMTIDTACSSSLVAVHQGVKALRTGESRVAVACGTQVILNPEMYIGESKLKMLSPNGRSAMWDEAADGYARGEGVAAVVLKRLSDAIADGDHIECIIRETGVNQDGFSNGLTVPNTDAQASLIRRTYARAGLDPEHEPRDRPQFFEAHGTGTPAGDPKEAAAIHQCFGRHANESRTPLYVGSVKTVIGHLEGCAGLAGLLKGSAMIQSGYIAPNLHFSRLNPRIEPFYPGLQVPTKLLPWPEIPDGVPRRVSVNSFGFGGTNAHAILEQYQSPPPAAVTASPKGEPTLSFTPFVFSAASEASLIEQLRAYSTYLKTQHQNINAADLAWTLHSRRSQLSTKTTFSALTVEKLVSAIDTKLAEVDQNANSTVGRRSLTRAGAPRLLGIFTGQGAQWAAMGAHLIRSSDFVSQRIGFLDESLVALPPEDRPTWRLRDELLAGEGVSRLGEAALSQPLCTAIQIVLVDLLRAAGITFAAVVGHSSGEIAAAYAAGFITAHDAVRIAYYRGLYARFAGNEKTGQKGAMMAAGTSWEDAQQLVESAAFKGRLTVAAHNSPGSVTMSGDADAVAEAKDIFDRQKKFARLLKVDTAYHSHHMTPCGDRYVRALRACGVRVNRERASPSCAWFSSVTASPKAVEPTDALQDVYWRDNMTGAVLFAEAIQNAVAAMEQIDLALEVGPHPALKGPATETISKIRTSPLPYSGTLSRGKNDVEAFSDALGFVWTYLPHSVDLGAFGETVRGNSLRQPKLVVGLPSYQWDHARSYWSESRISKRTRTRKHPHHEVLGFLSPDSNPHDMRWLNVLKRDEIPWLDGHQLQGQTVFPAAGYVAMALEASKYLAGDRPVKLFELHNLAIPKAITFDEGDSPGVETLVALTGVEHRLDHTTGSTTANFACYSVPVLGAGSEHDMELTASASVKIVYGTPDVAAISCTPLEDYNMSAVDPEQFYAAISELGYNYSGPFRTLSMTKRKLNQSFSLVDSYRYLDADVSQYLVHPTMLDVAFQASMLAYSAPGDDRLWSLSVPTAIGTIRVNPEVCAALPMSGTRVPVCAITDETASFTASIDILNEGGEHAMVQVEDLVLRPFAPATAADDRVMFTRTKLDVASPDGVAAVGNRRPSAYETELAAACERISYYYLRKWKSELGDVELEHVEPHWGHFLRWVDQTLSTASRGQHPTLHQEWSKDTPEDMESLTSQYSGSIDVQILTHLGQTLPAAIRGNAAPESIVSSNMLDAWYEKGLGFAAYHWFLGSMIKQVVHRYPHARILEIGARDGGATKSILENIGNQFSSYTYTNPSGSLPTTDSVDFKAYGGKVTCMALDIQRAPTDQGFKPQSYDIVVASGGVLGSVASLQTVLENARQLLKLGGHLILEEATNLAPVRHHLLMGSISTGWWRSMHGSRRLSPLLTPGDWHSALRKAGFSGVDTCTPEMERVAWPWSIMASQAVDGRVQFLRKPFSSPSPSPTVHLESLIVLGSGTLETARIAEEVVEYLQPFCGTATILDGLPTENEALHLNPMSTFLNLVDLDAPIFKDMTDERMDGLKRMLELAKHVVWVTHGGHLGQPYQMASISFGRSIRQEARHVNFSHMDVSDLQHDVSKAIAEYLVQQVALDEWEAPPSALADRQHRDFELLWSKEPEIFFDKGKFKIPRLVQDTERNARLNSSRRAITSTVALSEANVAVVSRSAGAPRVLARQISGKHGESGEVVVRVKSSSLNALHIAANAFLFLGIGKSRDGTSRVLLSTTNSCEASAVVSFTLPTDTALEGADTDSFVATVASELLAESLIQQLPAHSRVLVHCSDQDRFLAAALSWRAVSRAVHVTFTCSSLDSQHGDSWIRLNDGIPDHALRKLIRRVKPTHFLDVTTATSLGRRISQALPLGCMLMDSSTLFRREPSPSPVQCDRGVLLDRLVDALSGAGLHRPSAQDQVIPLDRLRTLDRDHPTSVIQWPSDGLAEVEICPVDARSLFSKDKTYLLVGLSGQIGRSLCEWLVANGAGCVCLTSRRPNVDERWLESFRDTGATVKVMALDVMDRNSLESAVAEIRATCPPIAGVANGAATFDDQLFANMSGDTMRRVLGPKVDGSNNLDRVFYHDPLDFFILFSSAVCVFGNAGQSNYAAANGYLDGLVKQRRRRGLAASAIDLGRVTGIGYVEAAGQAVQEQLVKKLGLPPVSEMDLRQVFGEAILAGYPRTEDRQSAPDAVITTGLRVVGDDEDLRGPWFNNPFFSHMVKESRVGALGSDDKDKKAMLPVGQQLAMAATKEAALEILQGSFAAKLRALLQLGDRKIDYEAPLLELGIDSLVAVEVRSWFLRELKVDVPVLKVVGGAPLAELCQWALEKVPEEFAPNAGGQQRESVHPTRDATAATQPPPRPNLQEPLQTEKSSAGSDTSSVSGYSLNMHVLRGTRATTSPAASTATPSSVGSDGDLNEWENAKRTSLIQPPVKFLKSQRISLPQSRFWFLRQLLDDPTTFNVVFSYHITGNLRVGDLERAIRIVANRHEALRTCFVQDEVDAGNAYQKILHSSPLRLERKKVESAHEVDVEFEKLRSHVFDLARGDVMRMVLLTVDPASHYLLVNYHHIVMDGASFNVFLSDLEKAYNGQSLGLAPRQYPDFSAAQRRALQEGDMQEELEYWRSVFPAGEQPPVLPLLPMARTSSRVAMKTFDTHQVACPLEPDLVARIRAVSRAQRSTPFHLHLAAFKALLFCFAGDDAKDLTIGIADAARNDRDVKESIGFFLNLLTLRFRRKQEQPFSDAIAEARNTAYAALGTSRLPFDVLLTELNVARSSLHSPFFQAFLDYRQGIQERHPWGNCQFEFRDVHPGRTAYDITLDVTDWDATHSLVMFRVQKSLYDLTAANLLLETYVHVLDALTRDPSLRLQDTPIFSEAQLTKAVQIGRGSNMVSDWPATLPHRIDQVAQENGDHVALMDGLGRVLTYSDMIKRIEAIGEALQNAGIGAGSRVLVYQQPSTDWPCSMLAIMRIGAVYVPLDLRNPIARLAAVAKDCAPSAILADNTTLDDAPQLQAADARIINVSDLPLSPSSRVPNQAQSDLPAAILYTSGSTGTPKGIRVTHAGLRNEIEGYTKTWGLRAERVLQQSAFTFNHSSDQMYTGLVNGGMVYIVPAEKRGDPVSITEIIQRHAITYTKATPSEYLLWMQFGGDNLRQASSWRFAFGGGEPLTSIVTQEFANLHLPQLRFFNSYGPTEISISSHKIEIPYRDEEAVRDMGRIPCGYSLPNYYTYIVDDQLRPVPVGMPGEICLGGAGVSLGYLNNPELTDKHFVPNPFATPEDVARGWTRMYRTGDIGHLMSDGAMVFHSRMAGDSQVKIRGLRIELSDIESNIVSAAGGALREAVVTLRSGDPPFLVAHVVFAPHHNIADKEAFLSDLLSRLPVPQYMVPVAAIPLDRFPLSNHSKVDRKAVQRMPLPERVGNPGAAGAPAEMTETMIQLKRVWKEVLGANLNKFGFELDPTTNFFLVGGNSLLVIRLQARIRQVFHAAIPLVKLMGASTLGEMARKIEESATVDPIDWEHETSPPSVPDFLQDMPMAAAAGETTAASAKTVLVTGATGFLGKHLLPQLAARQDVDAIHCIAVRDKPREGPLLTAPNIVYHAGDLSLPLLGLGEDEFRRLASQVDVILHLGAARSFWDNYHVLRPSNVDPVKELVKLAAPRRVPIHYVSTAGVLPRDEVVAASSGHAGSAARFTPPRDGSGGYTASKWAGERILERSAEALGVPSRVYRFVPATQERPMPKQELLDAFVRFVDDSGSVPDMGVWKGRVDLIPIEEVAQWLAESVVMETPVEEGDAGAAAATGFQHYESPLAIHTDELSEHIRQQRADGKNLQHMPVLQWFGRIKALGFNYLLASQEATVGDSDNGQVLESRR